MAVTIYNEVSRQTFDNLLQAWKEGREPNKNRLRTLFNKAVRGGRLDGIMEAPDALAVIQKAKGEATDAALLKEFCSRFVDMSAVPTGEQTTVALAFREVIDQIRPGRGLGEFDIGETLRHVRSGRVYCVTERPSTCRLQEADGLPYYRYQSFGGHLVWSRNMVEMEDGRFVRVETTNLEKSDA